LTQMTTNGSAMSSVAIALLLTQMIGWPTIINAPAVFVAFGFSLIVGVFFGWPTFGVRSFESDRSRSHPASLGVTLMPAKFLVLLVRFLVGSILMQE
jgi:hypothetical protein